MALNVGELEATLRLRDELSASIKAAQASVAAAAKSMGTEFASVGTQVALVNSYVKQFAGGDTISRANAMATALQATGGAATLTAGEQRGVNKTVTEAIEKYRALGKDAPAALLTLQKETAAAAIPTSAFKQLLSTLGPTIAAAFSVRAIFAFGKEAVRSFSEQEDALVRLSAALKAQGTFTPTLATQYEALSAKFQQTTIYADELTVGMMALLTQVGNVMPSEMEGALQAATNLASGLGIDLQAATMLVGKAFAGETGTLKRYGIVIDEATLKSGGATAVLKALNDQFGGQAQAQAATYSGQVAQLANTWDDFKETVGKVLTDILKPMLPALKEAAVWMQGLGQVVGWARQTFDSLLVTWAKTFKWMVDAKLKISELTNVFGVNDRQIAELKATSALYADTIKSLTTTQETVTKTVEVGSGAIRQRVVVDKEAIASAKKHAEELVKLTEKVHELEGGLALVPDSLKEIGRSYDEAKLGPLAVAVAEVERQSHIVNFGFRGMTEELRNVGSEAIKTRDELETFSRFDFTGPLQREFRHVGNAVHDLAASFTQLAQISGDSFGGVVRDLARVVGAMDIAKQSGTSLKLALTPDANGRRDWGAAAVSVVGIVGAMDAATSSASKTKNAMGGIVTGAQAGMAIAGPWGAAVGAAAGFLVGMFRNAEKAINATREAFVQTAGGLGALNVKAAEAGVTLTAMLDAKNPEQYKKAIDDLNAAFDLQKQDAADLKAAIQEYGFTIEQLGPAMQRQQLTEQAVTLMNQFRLLAGSGIDVGLVVEKMSGKLNDYLNLSVKTGMEVPLAMKPIIEKMIEMGTFTDANGVAITDLAMSGVTFSETMTQGFDRIVNKLTELINKIAGTTGALNAMPSSKTIDIIYNEVRPERSMDIEAAARGGLVTAMGVEYLAGGGYTSKLLPFRPRGTDTVPAMLTPGEGVVTTAGMQTLGVEGLRTLNQGGSQAPVIDFSAVLEWLS